MGKVYIDSVKYTIYATFEVNCIVEKSDVVGAIFGQTEGLLGEELDLRDLQKNGRIGRIEVSLTVNEGKTLGEIKIPSSLDLVETAVIAAAIETVDRVGPCEATIKVTKVEDNRTEKRKKVIKRAEEILKTMISTQIPDSREITEMVREKIKEHGLTYYGEEKLPAGPLIEDSEEIILVEGRADVLNLLRNNIPNAIAIGGAKIPKTIVDLTKRKETTVFLDGDRGGDIILKELLNAGAEIDYIARAPLDKEVEELTRKEIIRALRSKIKFDPSYIKHRDTNKKTKKEKDVKETKENKKENKENKEINVKEEEIKRMLEEIKGSLKALLVNEKGEVEEELSIKDLRKRMLSEKETPPILIFDGIITQRLIEWCNKKGIQLIAGLRTDNVKKLPEKIKIVTL